ncbi:MAG: alcohol dehydrogenase family protein [Luminiphilus sp.]|jgi:NADPH:quinone reductase-like Zn-dependent oxidoreductase
MIEIPTTMQAFVLMGHGDLDQLVFHDDWPIPELTANDVLIRVGACGLNNTDVNTRSAWYSKGNTQATTGTALANTRPDDSTWGGAAVSFPRIQGADAVGTVVRVGEKVDSAIVGHRVIVDGWMRDWSDPMDYAKTGYFGSERDGGFAQYAAVDYRQVHAITTHLCDAELATFACSYVTAENMLNRAQVGPNDSVLITGASGGVGSALVQLANRRRATCIAMCAAEKADAVLQLGADAVIDRNCPDVRAALRDAVGREPVSVVADVVGGSRWPDFINVLGRGGRYTCAGAIAGPIVEFDLRTFYLRDLTFTGATVPTPQTFTDLVGYIERDEIKPLLAARFPLKELHKAQTTFIEKRHIGNIVVEPN